MNNIFEMGATRRHGRLLDTLTRSITDLYRNNKLEDFSESVALVYTGNRKESDSCILVNIDNAENKNIKSFINTLNNVIPDYMHFKSGNRFVLNENETMLAGRPDLIIEVWSENNSILDREFKKYLYGTSSITEHWYIEQDSNIVECYYGQEKIENKNLGDILVARDGIEFDLRYLKLD